MSLPLQGRDPRMPVLRGLLKIYMYVSPLMELVSLHFFVKKQRTIYKNCNFHFHFTYTRVYSLLFCGFYLRPRKYNHVYLA